MKPYESKDIRNVGLLSHGGAGKTSLAEACLFNSGATTRLGKVDDENSSLDFEPEEQKRRTTTKASVASIEHAKAKINLIDTPGVADFFADTRQSFNVMDTPLLLVSAPDGVEVGTSRCWSLISESGRAAAIALSKLDRAPKRFQAAVDEIRHHLTPSAVAVQLPIVDGEQFVGLVDLLHLRAWRFASDDSGQMTTIDIPAAMAHDVETHRIALMESVAETDEHLMEVYFEGGELPDDEFTQGFRKAFHGGALVPVYCVAPMRNLGVRALMDAIVEVFPSPIDRGAWEAEGKDGKAVMLEPDASAPLAAYVFKTLVDPYAGTLSLLRIISGTMGPDGQLLDTATGEHERYTVLNTIVGKKLSPVARAEAGDIVTLAKLKEVRTRHTLTTDDRPVVVKGLPLKEPVISFAVIPKTQSDEGKVSSALQKLLIEDIALQVGRDEQSKHFLLSGMGQVHIETSVDKLQRKFGVAVLLEPPRVPYRETIRSAVKGVQGRHRKQTGGAGQFGDIFIDMEPNTRGEGFQFIDNVVGGAIPRNYIPAVEKGMEESMARGYLAGFPVVDLRVRLYDGSYHPVDSSEMAFKAAAWIAFKNAMAKANPCLLEPIMRIEVTVPEENMGDVMGDMNSRRGRVQGMDSQGRLQIIRAQVPLAEVLRYAPDLRSMTSGRGEFHLEFSHYDIVPEHLAQKVIDAHKREDEHHH